MNRSMRLTAIALVAVSFAGRGGADPCGMVPPISIMKDRFLARAGIQRTYVFYKDGFETFIIQPGFEGSVEEFGMLTPFPAPPSMRKVPDDVFTQIANAIDPPEIYVS